MSKSILITGGAGFIGSNFVSHVLSRWPDWRVVVVDALTYAGSVRNLPDKLMRGTTPHFQFWYGDVVNADLMTRLVADADIIVHFAAETHVTRSIFNTEAFFNTDVLGTQALANAIVKAGSRVELFLHISTSEVYGTADTSLMNELHPLNPRSPYASAKCGADRLVYSYFATYDLPTVIVRPFNQFGPRQHLEKLVPRCITSVLLDEPIIVHGDGAASRDFLYVEDLCAALEAIIEAPRAAVVGEVFNVAAGEDRSVLSIALDVKRLMERSDIHIQMTADRPGQVSRQIGDAGKIRRALGWRPRERWEVGLAKTIEWFRRNRDWWQAQLWARRNPIHLSNGTVVMH